MDKLQLSSTSSRFTGGNGDGGAISPKSPTSKDIPLMRTKSYAMRVISLMMIILMLVSQARMLVRVSTTGQDRSKEDSAQESLVVEALGGRNTSSSSTYVSTSGNKENLVLVKGRLSKMKTSISRSKPIMYLDIGPYKTGSTFLQCTLARNGYEILQRDNVLYLGTCAFECLRRINGHASLKTYEFCLGHSGDSVFDKKNAVVEKLRVKLSSMARDGSRNALMVWEYFSDTNEERIQNLMLALQGWDVRVIVHYRRLYDWLPSLYSQLHRPGTNGRQQFLVWPGDIITKKSGHRVAGKIRAPFDMYSPAEQERLQISPRYRGVVRQIISSTMHPTERAMRLWMNFTSNITIFDMHRLPPKSTGKSDPLLEHLFCHVIPSMHETCKAVHKNEFEILEEGRNSQFYANNYDLLALHAHQHNLHPDGITRLERTEAWSLIQDRQEVVLNRTSTDFPLTCLSNSSLEFFLNLSLNTESSILPGFEDDHREGFESAMRGGKFCHIDVNRTLHHPDWRDFFLPYVCVASHVLERDMMGRWIPTFDGTKSIKDVFFANSFGRSLKPSVPQLHFVGFLLVMNTGMSAFVDFMRNTGRAFLRNVNDPDALLRKRRGRQLNEVACIFGPITGTASVPPLFSDAQQCPLTSYALMVHAWVKSLSHLKANAELSVSHDQKEVPSVGRLRAARLQVSLTTVVMLREPMDRLLSLFLEWRRQPQIARGINVTVTLESWLLWLGKNEQARKHGPLRDQFRSLAGNLNRAISNIDGNAQTLVLLHECFNVSMQILSHRHPSAVDQGNVHSFLNQGVSSFISSEEDIVNSEGILGVNLTDLRPKVKELFASDYKLYAAGVVQFRRLLETSVLSPTNIQECLDRIS